MKLTKVQAQVRIQSIEAQLTAAIHAAWTKFQATRAQFDRPTPRTIANVLNNHVEDEIRTALSGVPGVNILDKDGRFLVGFSGLLLRFKKVDSEYRTRNYRTPSSVRFDRQERLPGIGDFPRLTVGYRLGRLADKLLEIVVIYAKGRRVDFVLPLAGNAAPTQLPLRPAASQPARVRVRSTAAKRQKSGPDQG